MDPKSIATSNWAIPANTRVVTESNRLSNGLEPRPRPSHTTQKLTCRSWESNPDLADFKFAASNRWARPAKNGRNERNRTSDTSAPNRALYQAELHSVNWSREQLTNPASFSFRRADRHVHPVSSVHEADFVGREKVMSPPSDLSRGADKRTRTSVDCLLVEEVPSPLGSYQQDVTHRCSNGKVLRIPRMSYMHAYPHLSRR